MVTLAEQPFALGQAAWWMAPDDVMQGNVMFAAYFNTFFGEQACIPIFGSVGEVFDAGCSYFYWGGGWVLCLQSVLIGRRLKAWLCFTVLEAVTAIVSLLLLPGVFSDEIRTQACQGWSVGSHLRSASCSW